MQSGIVVCVVFLYVNFANCFNTSDGNVDNVSFQLYSYREKTPKPALLTASSGQPIYDVDTDALNGDLLINQYFLDSIDSAVNARIPAREAFAKAAAAHGYFIVTNDVTKYTKAKLFEKVGKKTKIFARLGISQVFKGQSDTTLAAARGMAVKFYTEQGNLDLLGVNVPVYFYKNPLLFKELFHSFGPNPKTSIQDPNAIIDFIVQNPVTLHSLLWFFSEYGLPKGYRHMNAFPIHSFQLYNEKGQSYFARFKILSELGYESLSLDQAAAISSYDFNFFTRDLYNSIERKNYPTWSLEMDVLNVFGIKNLDFDPFDVTRLWPNGTYTTVPIGKIILDRNVENYFAEAEQAAFNPINLVPGIKNPPEKLYMARTFAYSSAQKNRLGSNYNKIPINCPMYAETYNRDGDPPVLDNGGDAVNYYPNSFNGPVPYYDPARPRQQFKIVETNEVHLEDSRKFYQDVLALDDQKQRLVDNFARASLRVKHTLQEKLLNLFQQVDPDLAARYEKTLDKIKKNVKLPNVVEDLDDDNLNPFSNA
ncbi:catalase [Plutella xylostella]|uniref:catalase n=1 Tax=Plutella xylostella TaxID=51655 RepID=UPI0020322C64|nr:catalase [Plutella xylostella]